ncbi:hypothetical protein JRT13AECX_JRT13AEC_04163 [Escherichia coli]|nr:hypothetical protein JRT64AECX_JRT64AEC_00711 [Escherichia coli]CAJ1298277.1 hypothetical protein JRT13AECX_JRT13AEC_04163 [Escherichia coli]
MIKYLQKGTAVVILAFVLWGAYFINIFPVENWFIS